MPTLRTSADPTVEDTPDGLRITMRAPRKSGCILAFLAVWTTGWTFGGAMALRALFQAGGPWWNPARLFLVAWLAGWAVGEAFGIAALAFLMGGSEIVTVDAEKLTRRAQAFGRGLDWRYPLADVSSVRTSADDDGRAVFVTFDFRGKPVRFGTNLTEEGAARVAEEIVRRHPALAPR